MSTKNHKVGYLFITPAVLHLVVFAILPIGYALHHATREIDEELNKE